MTPVDILVCGAGWLYEFLPTQFKLASLTHAATTTTGRDGTLKFAYDSEVKDEDGTKQFKTLPDAKTVLVTFPLKSKREANNFIRWFLRSRAGDDKVRVEFILLGSTGIFTDAHWNDDGSPYDTSNARAEAEDEFLRISQEGLDGFNRFTVSATVLNLSGLHGGQRQPKNWVSRVIKKRADIGQKKALHLIHGTDVSRGIVLVHQQIQAETSELAGRRWIVTDTHVHDWWDLLWKFGSPGGMEEITVADGTEKINLQQAVFEFMLEQDVRALPRAPDTLGRVLDGRGFWKAVKSWPTIKLET